MKRLLSALLAVVLILALATPALAAAPAQTTEQIFNSATLVPRESTNPILAKYVEAVIAEIISENSKMTTYDKTVAIYNWVDNNIAFTEHYTLPVKSTTYIEDAAIYGFANKQGPCEVDSATLVYLLRAIGLNAQWTYGKMKTSSKYHLWTEVVIDNNVFAFDTYPGMEKSFQHRTSSAIGETTIGGFPFMGYVEDGGPKTYGKLDKAGNPVVLSSAEGNMNNMLGKNGEPAPLNTGEIKLLNITRSHTDGTSFTWQLPFVGKEQATMASIDKFYESTDTKAVVDTQKTKYSNVAGKTLTVYTVKVGTNINLEGASMFVLGKLRMVGGKLQTSGSGNIDFNKDTKWSEFEAKVMDAGGGKTYNVLPKEANVSVLMEGYYVIDVYPWDNHYIDTNPSSPTFYMVWANTVPNYGCTVIHVVK